MAVVIEGGQEPGLHLGAQLLHLGGVEAEIVARKRANTDELALALEHVDEHGEFVDPNLAHPAAPEIDAVVIGELAAGLQAAVLVEVGLQVLAVAVHGAELVDTDNLAVLADTAQLDEGGAGGHVVPNGGLLLAGEDKELAFAELLVEDLETGTVQTAEDFDTVVGAVLALGDGHVETARGLAEFGANTVPEIMKGEDNVADAPGVFLHDELALEYGSTAVTPQVTAIGEVLVGAVEQGVEVLHLVERHLVDKYMGMKAVVLCQAVAKVGVDDDCGGGKLAFMGFYPRKTLRKAHTAGLGKDSAHIGILDFLRSEAGAVVGSALGIVFRNFRFVIEGNAHWLIC